MTINRLWHYTLGTTLLRIVADKRIRRARVGLAKGERPAVWFTRRNEWEPTATKGLMSAKTGEVTMATREVMEEAGGALIRIEVPATVGRHTWADHRRVGQVDPRIADALEKDATERGSDPAEWRVSYHDVPWTAILSIEALVGDEWVCVGRPEDDGGLWLDASFVAQLKDAIERHRQAIEAQ
jgi:hypothetical protein